MPISSRLIPNTDLNIDGINISSASPSTKITPLANNKVDLVASKYLSILLQVSVSNPLLG